MNNTLFIDGREVPFEIGQTIMDAALAAGIYIPHLCHKPGLSPHGSCKLCTVEVDGRSVSACTLPASDGMQVANNTPAL
ncbi:MAG: NADP oxidoreductase, partial [Thiothrix lacustris]